MRVSSRIALAITSSFLLLLSGSPPMAADMLPLRRGIFVDARVTCAGRSNADTESFWEDQLNSAHVSGTIEAVSKKGRTYRVKMFMEGLGGVGGDDKYHARAILRIASPSVYSISYNNGPSSTMRWCAQKIVD